MLGGKPSDQSIRHLLDINADSQHDRPDWWGHHEQTAYGRSFRRTSKLARSAEAIMNKPLPPKEISVRHYVETRWSYLLESWRRGWAADSDLDALEGTIEFHRDRVFEKREHDGIYDYELDWVQANSFHEAKIDFVRNRKSFNDDLKRFWSEWENRSHLHISNVSLESLRSMVLVNGAAIVAALAVISGQVGNPWPPAVLVAKITIFTSVLSLLMMATGHAILVERVGDIAGRVRSVLVGNARHGRLYALHRYLRRYFNRAGTWATALIYGSISVFGISAMISACILLFSSGPK